MLLKLVGIFKLLYCEILCCEMFMINAHNLLSYSNKTDFLMDQTRLDKYLTVISKKSNLLSDSMRTYFEEIKRMLDSLKVEVENFNDEEEPLFFNKEEVMDLIDYTEKDVKKRINYILYQIQDSVSIIADLLDIGDYEGFRSTREVVKRNDKVTRLVSKTIKK